MATTSEATPSLSSSNPLDAAIDLINSIGTHFSKTNRTKLLALLTDVRSRHTAPSGGPASTTDATSLTHSLRRTFDESMSQVTSALSKLSQQIQEVAREPLPPSPPQTLPTPRAPIASPPRARELEVVISLSKVDRKSPIRAMSLAQLKQAVDKALAASSSRVPTLHDLKVHGVRKRANGDIIIRAVSEEQAQLLLLHATEWLTSLDPGAAPERKTYTVLANFVPSSFNPYADGASTSIYYDNQGVIPSPNSILRVRWLRDGPQLNGKEQSSLVLTLDSEAVADRLIYTSLSLAGAICSVQKYVPMPTQCYRCQEFGHLAKACPHSNDPSTLRCARCAGHHLTKDCRCTHKTKCTVMRTCRHVTVHCANCAGPHKSFDNSCPSKIRAKVQVADRYRSFSPYFNPSFSPRSVAVR